MNHARPHTTLPDFTDSPKKRNLPTMLSKVSKSVRNLKEPSSRDETRSVGILKHNPVLTHVDSKKASLPSTDGIVCFGE